MTRIAQHLKTVKTSTDFDLVAYELKELMNSQAVVNADGYALNYFADTDKLVLKNFKTDEVFTHSFGLGNSNNFTNRYFQNKKINIQNYSNIALNEKHNFIIPIFNQELKAVGEERIYWDVSTNQFKKIKQGEISGNFYYYTKQDNISDCEIIVIAESVANVLSLAELYQSQLDKVIYIASLGSTNYLNALKSVMEVIPITKTVISLVDNDEAGLKAYQQVKEYLSDKHLIDYSIISPEPDKDLSDMFCNDKIALKSEIDYFFNNAGIYISNALKSELGLMLENKKELINNFNKFIYQQVKEYLLLYKFLVANNQLYVINPQTMTYQLLDLHIIERFVITCLEVLNLHNINFKNLVENLLNQLKASGTNTKFDLSMNFKNGSIDLGNQKINNYFIQSVNYVDFNYYPDHQYNLLFNDGNNPVRQFLTTTLPNTEDYTMLCDCLGFLLTKNNQEYLVSLYGSGANGKSLLMELIKKALDNVAVDISLDEALHNENTRIRLQNKLVALSSEFSGQLNNRDLQNFKTLVSGQPISAKSLYKDQITIENYAKFITSTNEIISASTMNNDALLRRLAIIQFTQKFTPKQEVKETLFKQENLELFFNFLIRCALDYQYVIRFSSNAQNLLQKINTSTNNVLGFCQEYELKSGMVKVQAKKLFELYNSFCQENNFKPLGNNKFAEKIDQQGISKGRNSSYIFYLLDKDPTNHQFIPVVDWMASKTKNEIPF